uniref:Uncharacterized protein n=1 Tax=Parascaris equorum TaxID=6256 RepID=A0A914RA96_PAREQ
MPATTASVLFGFDHGWLRDMVVDKQNPSCQPQIESPYKQQQQQQYWTPSPVGGPTPSPSNMRSTPANSNSPLTPMMHPSRISQGELSPDGISKYFAMKSLDVSDFQLCINVVAERVGICDDQGSAQRVVRYGLAALVWLFERIFDSGDAMRNVAAGAVCCCTFGSICFHGV